MYAQNAPHAGSLPLVVGAASAVLAIALPTLLSAPTSRVVRQAGGLDHR